jgi:hypothetical protein
MSVTTPELWRELHVRALTFEGEDDGVFLRRWSDKVPRFGGGCRCSSFWIRWMKFNPPVFHPSEKYFEWTVNGHNAVNQKLGKPQLSVDEARKLYV